jgi:hypothetical protein
LNGPFTNTLIRDFLELLQTKIDKTPLKMQFLHLKVGDIEKSDLEYFAQWNIAAVIVRFAAGAVVQEAGPGGELTVSSSHPTLVDP